MRDKDDELVGKVCVWRAYLYGALLEPSSHGLINGVSYRNGRQIDSVLVNFKCLAALLLSISMSMSAFGVGGPALVPPT